MRTTRGLAALLAATSLIFGACQGGGGRQGGASPAGGGTPAATSPAATSPAASPAESPTGSPAGSPAASPAGSPAESPTGTGGGAGNAEDFKACEVSDTGGIDDKGFNQNAWEGLQAAQREFGLSEDNIKFLESTSDADYQRNINTFIQEGCDVIITVGYLLGDATKAAAEANPDQKFGIVDFAYDPPLPNVTGIVFQMDEPSMLAAYLACSMSETGTIATFGGVKIPPVTQFMDGFQAGANYYNEQKGGECQVLGWDAERQEGSFVGNFEDTAEGRRLAEGFIQEDADVIFPVAGPVGLGAMAAVQDANQGGGDRVYYIGVDVDQALSVPQYEPIMLTSVLKRIDNGVKAVVQSVIEDTFEGGVLSNNLENEGTGLAPFHAFEGEVPAEVVSELDALRSAIIAGEVKPADWYTGAPGQ